MRMSGDVVTVVLLAFLLVGLVAGVALVETVIRRSDVGAALVFIFLVAVEMFGYLDLVLITNPVRVTIEDLLFAVILTAAIARALRLRRLTAPQRLSVALLLVMSWAIYRGFGPFGVPAAINESRSLLRFIAVVFYFSTVEPRRQLLERIAWMWLAMCGAIALIVVARWVGNAAGIYQGFFVGYETYPRVVHSDKALVLAQGAIIALPLYLERNRGLVRYITPALLAFVVLLQHRTVWVVTITSILYLLYRERAVARRLLAVIAGASILVAILAATVFSRPEAELSDQLARSAQSTGTFEWRVEGWRMLLTDSGPKDLQELVLGRPYGTGWTRSFVPGWPIDVSPHNFYIESFLRVGIVGLAIILAVYAVAIWATHRASQNATMFGGLLSPVTLHVVVAVQLLYFITYTPDMPQAVLVGLSCAMLNQRADTAATHDRLVARR
jgi:O-antigen ligase